MGKGSGSSSRSAIILSDPEVISQEVEASVDEHVIFTAKNPSVTSLEDMTAFEESSTPENSLKVVLEVPENHELRVSGVVKVTLFNADPIELHTYGTKGKERTYRWDEEGNWFRTRKLKDGTIQTFPQNHRPVFTSRLQSFLEEQLADL